MPKYLVTVLLENKKEIDDPEGQTIYRDLILRGGYNFVLSVQSAKCLNKSSNGRMHDGNELSISSQSMRPNEPRRMARAGGDAATAERNLHRP